MPMPILPPRAVSCMRHLCDLLEARKGGETSSSWRTDGLSVLLSLSALASRASSMNQGLALSRRGEPFLGKLMKIFFPLAFFPLLFFSIRLLFLSPVEVGVLLGPRVINLCVPVDVVLTLATRLLGWKLSVEEVQPRTQCRTRSPSP